MIRVLIAEDNSDFRELLVTALSGAGFRLQAVKDGRAAIEIIESDPPDVLVTDFLMPEADGLDVCLAMQRAAGDGLTPALILTGAHPGDGRLTEATQIPGVMMRSKPVKMKDLSELIATLANYRLNDSEGSAV